MIKLKYIGGQRVKTSGCGACGSSNNKLERVTAEELLYPSSMTTDGYKKTYFRVGREYALNDDEAEFLLNLEFIVNGVHRKRFVEV